MPQINIQPLQSPYLKVTRDARLFALHRAALEWDIEEPIVIETPEDVKSRASWRDTLEPFHHQVRNLITFCRRLPVTLLADDVGLGKTISAGLILSELISRGRVSKTLIICPKILMPQWQTELRSKFSIEATYGSGVEAIRNGIAALKDQDMGVFITTYASAREHLNRFEQAGFQMLILDEAHKLRNLYGTASPPVTALRIRKALADRNFKYVLMLTATPIQNRLWDLYSLVDLLTVARGHQNPFGSEERFARRFITDKSDQARKLNQAHKDEFRAIVYGYMSRVRRADAQLAFPVRKVQLHRVQPSAEELELIRVVGREVQSLNKLAQISLLKALVSSPQALLSQLRNMAAKGTVRQEAVALTAAAASKITITSKLRGLELLVERLRNERPQDWRMVIFTQLRETQNAIAEHLEAKGISFGTINGDSARRNQETIRRFSTVPPECNVIVSTEAGSEGVNLQVANVLVNYDLPWNPMIVEQRIGRIQRLGSLHANVTIFNAILQGTFEEYIVGRLMEKLQLATTAIGDIDSLLEAAGLDDDDGEVSGFEEMVRRLVVASLEGKNVEKDTQLKAESISQAKIEIEREEANINSLLGASDDPLKKGPRAPKMSTPTRSMGIKDFVLAAMQINGRVFSEEKPGVYFDAAHSERIAFEDTPRPDETIAPQIYASGRAAFDRLLAAYTSSHECLVEGLSTIRRGDMDEICAGWTASFGGVPTGFTENGVARKFAGKALVRARVSVAHDSFEKIVEVDCESRKSLVRPNDGDTNKLDPASLGLPPEPIIDAILRDPDVREFSRFYVERREEEVKAAGDDDRMKAKLQDDFTPKLEPSLVGLSGSVSSDAQLSIRYKIDGGGEYTSLIQISNRTGQVVSAPQSLRCEATGKDYPADCIETCAVSKKRVLRHVLVKSEGSDIHVLPEHILTCAISGKRVASTETALSAVTRKACLKSLLKTCGISGRLGEPEFFGRCAFTECDALKEELMTSQVSSRQYRKDQDRASAVSGVRGHRSEFVECVVTAKSLLLREAERCEVSSSIAAPGALMRCEASGKRVIPSLMGKCAVSGKNVLAKLLVTSSVSKAGFLKEHGVESRNGKFCLPAEGISCTLHGILHHPEDACWCAWTGVPTCRESVDVEWVLKPLREVLSAAPSTYGKSAIHASALDALSSAIGKGNYTVQSEAMTTNGYSVVLAVESSAWLGFKKQVFAFVYSIKKNRIEGKILEGRRENGRWRPV